MRMPVVLILLLVVCTEQSYQAQYTVYGVDEYFDIIVSDACNTYTDCYKKYTHYVNAVDVLYVCYEPANKTDCILPEIHDNEKYISFGLAKSDQYPVNGTFYLSKSFVANFNFQCQNLLTYDDMQMLCITYM